MKKRINVVSIFLSPPGCAESRDTRTNFFIPLELILTLLPGSVFEPLSDVKSASLDTVLKLLALSATVLHQFLMVVNLLLRDTDGDLLTLLGLAKNLLGRDLHWRGILVLDLIGFKWNERSQRRRKCWVRWIYETLTKVDGDDAWRRRGVKEHAFGA